MSHLKCSARVLNGLVAFLGYTLIEKRNIPTLDLNDIESVREMLRVLKPDKVEYEYFDAIIQEYRGDFAESINTLRHLLEARPKYASAKSFLAAALYKQKDPAWQTVAEEVLDNPDSLEDEITMMHALHKQNEVEKGMMSREEFDEYIREITQKTAMEKAMSENAISMQSTQGLVPNYAVRM